MELKGISLSKYITALFEWIVLSLIDGILYCNTLILTFASY